MRPHRPRVFLVDDNDGLRTAIRELLTESGIEVVGEARDSRTALQAIPPAAALLPLVALMDVGLPGPVNGIQVTRHLRERCAGVQVIVFTAFPGAAMERAAHAAGAVSVLLKGVRAETVVAEITRVWSAMPLAS